MEVDDEVDVPACHPLLRRADDVTELVEFDHPHADELGGGAQPLHALVLGAGLLRPHADHADRAFDAGQHRDRLLRCGDLVPRGGSWIGGDLFDGFHQHEMLIAEGEAGRSNMH